MKQETPFLIQSGILYGTPNVFGHSSTLNSAKLTPERNSLTLLDIYGRANLLFPKYIRLFFHYCHCCDYYHYCFKFLFKVYNYAEILSLRR